MAKKKVTIDNTKVDATLTNFAVLINVVDSDLDISRADGKDIYFKDSTETTVLDCEFEDWIQGSGTLVCWVRLPSISSSVDTDFYMYYGDGVDHSSEYTPSATWRSEYEGVWHLNDDFLDSTANNNDGTNSGSGDIAGQIADGQDFDGINDYIQLQYASLPIVAYQTMTAWVKCDLSGASQDMGIFDYSQLYYPYQGPATSIRYTDGALGIYSAPTLHFATVQKLSDDTWTMMGLRVYCHATAGTIEISKDGGAWTNIFSGYTLSTYPAADSYGRIGASPNNVVFSKAIIDECRIACNNSSFHNTDAWIKAEYENQKTGSAFLSFTAITEYHFIETSSMSFVSGNKATLYGFFAQDDYNGVALEFPPAYFPGTPRTFFDVGEGGSIGTSQDCDDSGIIEVEENFWCIWIMATANATGSGKGRAYIADGETIDFAGDDSSGIHAWGVRTEHGAFPQSYFPSLSGGSTRQPDSAYFPADKVYSWFRNGAHTIEWIPEAASTTPRASAQNIYMLYDGGTGYKLRVYWDTDDKIKVAKYDGSWTILVASLALTVAHKTKHTIKISVTEGSIELPGTTGGTKQTGTNWTDFVSESSVCWYGMGNSVDDHANGQLCAPYKTA